MLCACASNDEAASRPKSVSALYGRGFGGDEGKNDGAVKLRVPLEGCILTAAGLYACIILREQVKTMEIEFLLQSPAIKSALNCLKVERIQHLRDN